VSPLAFVFTCVALTLVYMVVPYRDVALRHAAVGGVVAGVLFELAKRGFGLYVAKFPTYTLIYGAFAIIPLFLLWLYVSWVVVLFGATLTASLPAWRAGRMPLLTPKDAT
jgi:membrane protein